MSKPRIEAIVAEECARGGFTGPVTIRSGSPWEGVCKNLDSPSIEITWDSGYEERRQDLERRHPFRFWQVARALIQHEINHSHYGDLPGAPDSSARSIELLEEIASVLQAAGIPNVPVGQGHSLYTWFNNLFLDYLDNTQLGLTEDFEGMWLFYEDNKPEGGKHRPLFSAFLGMQQWAYARTEAQVRLLEDKLDEGKETWQAVREFYAETDLHGKDFRPIFDPGAWKGIARTFTEKLVPLIEKDKLQQPEYIRVTFVPLDKGGFPVEVHQEDRQMKEVWRKFQQGKQPGKGKKAGEGEFTPPNYLDPWHCLKLLYQRMARNLELKVRASTREESMPVTWYQRRRFDPEQDKIARARPGISRRGRVELQVRPFPIEVPAHYHERPRNLPEIRLALLDTSDSTRRNIGAKDRPTVLNPWANIKQQWSDDSIYHYELMTWFSLVEFLRKQGALRHTSVKLAAFSSTTRYAKNLDEATRLALSPQFGNTYFDIDTMFGQRSRRKCLLFSLSDGSIWNWNDWYSEPVTEGPDQNPGVSIRDEFIRQARQNFYFHFQVGEPSNMSRDLEAAGLPVFYDDGRELATRVIDLTRQYVSQGNARVGGGRR